MKISEETLTAAAMYKYVQFSVSLVSEVSLNSDFECIKSSRKAHEQADSPYTGFSIGLWFLLSIYRLSSFFLA